MERVDTTYRLGPLRAKVIDRLLAWEDEGFGERLWAKDPTLWFPDPTPEIVDRLGWLTLPWDGAPTVPELRAFADEVIADGIVDVVLLGMGGSSLAPEMYGRVFGAADGYGRLTVLDSTHPVAVREVHRAIDPATTLFIVSSKSGTTIETISLFRYFWDATGALDDPGRHFVAVTDPGTPLQELAETRGFRRVFHAPPDVGGRYSAFTEFGLVPASLIGVDLEELLRRARVMAAECSADVPASQNPGLMLGAALGELHEAGRDKLTYLTSPGLQSFAAWAEQLVAESTGKDGKGIVPVAGEPLGRPTAYADDRVFFVLQTRDEPAAPDETLRALSEAGHPVIVTTLPETTDLAQEIFRHEVAIAAAGAIMGIHPFNQPDVQLAKDLARRAMAGEHLGGEVEELAAIDEETWQGAVERWETLVRDGDYAAIQAYLPPYPETEEAAQALRAEVRDRRRVATTFGFGPRFLHSTGQLHKGGPNSGVFLQVVDDPIADDLEIPETSQTFGQLIRAQAIGDYHALVSRGRRVVRVRIPGHRWFGTGPDAR